MMSNAAKSFNILATGLSVLHNYFNSPTKLFSVFCYIFRHFSAKPFFFVWKLECTKLHFLKLTVYF